MDTPVAGRDADLGRRTVINLHSAIRCKRKRLRVDRGGAFRYVLTELLAVQVLHPYVRRSRYPRTD